MKLEENKENNCDRCLNKKSKKKFIMIVKKVAQTIVNNRALIAVIASSLGIGGSEIVRNFNNKYPLEERYMCKPGYIIRLENWKENEKVNICGCEVKIEEIRKVKKGDKTIDIVDLRCEVKD